MAKPLVPFPSAAEAKPHVLAFSLLGGLLLIRDTVSSTPYMAGTPSLTA